MVYKYFVKAALRKPRWDPIIATSPTTSAEEGSGSRPAQSPDQLLAGYDRVFDTEGTPHVLGDGPASPCIESVGLRVFFDNVFNFFFLFLRQQGRPAGLPRRHQALEPLVVDLLLPHRQRPLVHAAGFRELPGRHAR